MRIWDAILEGCKKTLPFMGGYFQHIYETRSGVEIMKIKACALGAAWIGITEDTERCNVHNIRKEFPEMKRYFECPVSECLNRFTVMQGDGIVVHLNDSHEWRREDIAFWLRDQIDPESKDPIEFKEDVTEVTCKSGTRSSKGAKKRNRSTVASSVQG